MTEPQPTPELTADIRSLLARLRWRIRAYVWIEGLTLAIIWLGVTFWIGLAIDYLPVLAGASEMPKPVRALLLGAVAAVLVWVLYRWVLQRAFVSLSGRSMAVLLERQFQGFHDSLLTAVELAETPQHAADFNPDMLAHTTADARTHLDLVKLGRVFNFVPLLRNVLVAVLAVLSVVLFGIFARDAFGVWTQRMYLLSDQAWPRRAHIEVLDFPGKQRKAAKGSDLTIRVRADATREVLPPEVCTIYYRTEEGDRGRVNMSKDGQPRDGYQHYLFDGKPFKGVLSSVRFDVVGYDHRVRNYVVEVVDSPAVVDVQLDCQLPAYTQLLPRQLAWSAGTQLPRGTQITIHVTASKDLIEATIYDPETDTTTIRDYTLNQPDCRRFRYDIPRLDRDVVLDITLRDTDGVTSERPYRMTIAAVQDQPPTVDVLLAGIGSAITPEARLPVRGEISDDYGIAKAWFELQLAEDRVRTFPFEPGPSGAVQSALDLRQQRARDDDPLELKPDTQVTLTLKAEDKYDLEKHANVGQGDRTELDVVRPDELLALLEARELGLRRRFDQMIAEMTETRDSLIRVKAFGRPLATSGDEPEDTSTDASDDGDEPDDADDASSQERVRSLRLLRVQRAVQHSQRAAQELLGIAAAFEDIREELINNRVDTAERKRRLQELIADPLKQIANDRMPDFERHLQQLESRLDAPDAGREEAAVAVEKADRILLAMRSVLERMLEMETYNELVDIVRSIIRQQEELMERTKEQRKRQALDLIK